MMSEMGTQTVSKDPVPPRCSTLSPAQRGILGRQRLSTGPAPPQQLVTRGFGLPPTWLPCLAWSPEYLAHCPTLPTFVYMQAVKWKVIPKSGCHQGAVVCRASSSQTAEELLKPDPKTSSTRNSCQRCGLNLNLCPLWRKAQICQ